MKEDHMACCGQARKVYNSMPVASRRFAASAMAAPIFEYTGMTGMTVGGAATGRVYRFDRPGARVAVDARDMESLARVPHLRRVVIGG
jgi:hypothetical protein